MDITELLNYLELDEPGEFEYFEHLADLLELEEEVGAEACYTLFSAVPERTLTELISNYFEDIMENLPDDTVDIYTLLTTIRQSLLGLARNVENPDGLRLFVDEFVKFRSWYTLDSHVRCKRISDGHISDCTVGEALALCRMEKLNGDEYDYDFSNCLDYDLDEYSMSLSDMMEASGLGFERGGHAHGHDLEHDEDEYVGTRRRGSDDDYDGDDSYDDEEDTCGCGHHHSHGGHHHHGGHEGFEASDSFDAFSDGLIDHENPVIDGEYEED